MGGYGYGSHGPAKTKGLQPLNPPFDSRMLSIGSPQYNTQKTALTRGFAVSSNDLNSDQKGGGNFGGKRGMVQFLYNPNTVAVNLQMSPTQPSEAKAQAVSEMTGGDGYSQAQGMILAGGFGSVNLDLLYDRTYEVNTKNSKNLASSLGCQVDVMAWYALLGVNSKTAVGQNTTYNYGQDSPLTLLQQGPLNAPHTTTTTVQTLTTADLSPQRYILWQEIGLFMGPALKFTGIVNNLSITYTHFTQALVPIRCQVSLGMLLIPHVKDKVLDSIFKDQTLSWVKNTSSTTTVGGLPSSKVDPTLGGLIGPGGL